MTIVLNGGDYLAFCLRNSYALARQHEGSRIAIVEGADTFSPTAKNGLSADGTRDIVFSTPDPKGIISYERLGKVPDKRRLRNVALEMLRDMDWIIIKDHDELIKPEDFDKLAVLLSRTDRNVINLKHLLFWGDFGHRYPDDKSGHMLRVIRNLPTLNFDIWHTYPSIGTEDGLRRIDGGSVDSEVPVYHYGYVGPRGRISEKRVHRVGQDNWYWNYQKKPEKANKSLSEYDQFPLVKGENIPGVPWNEIVEHPLEDHPSEIKCHPWFGKDMDEIWGIEELHPTFV